MSAETPDLGEFELIERFFLRRQAARGAQSGVILGIGDDAAVLAVPPDAELVAAVDSIVAGRHFPEGTDARSIGHRALAVNLSDFAAMGATPAWATLALTMPSVDARWLERFSAGLLDLADVHGVALVGGDTTRGPLTVSVQVLGHIPRGTALRRSGARAGDLLAVTGTLGDAGAGLHFVTTPPSAEIRLAALELIRRFEYPAPRVRFGLAARGIATAAMDLSDGLIGDLPKLARASGLAAQVAVERLPLSEAMCILRDAAHRARAALRRTEGRSGPIELNVDHDRRASRRRRCDVDAERRGIPAQRARMGPLRLSLDPNHSLGPASPVSSASFS